MVDMRVATAERKHATETDRMISRTIRGILAFTSMPAEAFWHALEVSRTTYYNKINGDSPWTASEVASAADVLGVAVSDLYEGRVPPGLPRWDPTMDTARWPDSDEQPTLPGLDILIPFPRTGVWATAA
jgi:hypothetical protein